MDEKNYVGVSLSKPMGIVFEENDSEFGGIFVQSLTDGGIAATALAPIDYYYIFSFSSLPKDYL